MMWTYRQEIKAFYARFYIAVRIAELHAAEIFMSLGIIIIAKMDQIVTVWIDILQ